MSPLRLLALVLLTLAPVLAASAQGAAAVAGGAVEWEQLPIIPNQVSAVVHDIVFLRGPTPETDTLFQVESGFHRFDPEANDGEGGWTETCFHTCLPKVALATTAGTLLVGGFSGEIGRSTDGGRTWEEIDHYTGTLFQTALPSLVGPGGHGAIFGSSAVSPMRSFDDGKTGTWERSNLGPTGGEPITFANVPPSEALPEGRLLAGVWNGVTYSDDGGVSWQPSEGAYGYAQYIAHDFAFLPEPGHPYGGAMLAAIDDLEWDRDSTATVYRSDDGGATWERLHRFVPSAYGMANLNEVRLAVTADGAVWAGLRHNEGGPSYDYEGAIARSFDGGQTWAPAQAGYGRHAVNELVVARDGRLYAATVEGVWRTTAPVAVSAEAGPDEAAGAVGGAGALVLGAPYPNPSDGSVTVPLTLESATRVRVVTYDALGRAVGVLHEGPLRRGDHRLTLGTEGLPPGVYVVRAEGQAGGREVKASRRVTVLR
jgi:hypothetical protein